LIAFVTEQESQVHQGERLPGSSEVIESVFGKMKRLEQDQSKNGFTSLLLGLSALVSTTTNTVIQKALETVPTKQVEICVRRRSADAAIGTASSLRPL